MNIDSIVFLGLIKVLIKSQWPWFFAENWKCQKSRNVHFVHYIVIADLGYCYIFRKSAFNCSLEIIFSLKLCKKVALAEIPAIAEEFWMTKLSAIGVYLILLLLILQCSYRTERLNIKNFSIDISFNSGREFNTFSTMLYSNSNVSKTFKM